MGFRLRLMGAPLGAVGADILRRPYIAGLAAIRCVCCSVGGGSTLSASAGWLREIAGWVKDARYRTGRFTREDNGNFDDMELHVRG